MVVKFIHSVPKCIMEHCIVKRKFKRFHSYIARGSSEGPGVGAPECSSLRFQASALQQTGQRVPAIHKLRPRGQTWRLGPGSEVMVLPFCSWHLLLLICLENGHILWPIQSCSIQHAASLFRSSLTDHSNLNCSDGCLMNLCGSLVFLHRHCTSFSRDHLYGCYWPVRLCQ